MKSRKIKTDTKPISTAKYKPEVPVNFDYLVWIRKLSAIHHRSCGMKNTEIYSILRNEKIGSKLKTRTIDGVTKQVLSGGNRLYGGEQLENREYSVVWREVQRDIKDAERVLEYVQKGQFNISKPKKTRKQ